MLKLVILYYETISADSILNEFKSVKDMKLDGNIK